MRSELQQEDRLRIILGRDEDVSKSVGGAYNSRSLWIWKPGKWWMVFEIMFFLHFWTPSNFIQGTISVLIGIVRTFWKLCEASVFIFDGSVKEESEAIGIQRNQLDQCFGRSLLTVLVFNCWCLIVVVLGAHAYCTWKYSNDWWALNHVCDKLQLD